MEGLIGDIPGALVIGLVSLDDSYVGLRNTSPKFYSIRPHKIIYVKQTMFIGCMYISIYRVCQK